MDLSARTCSTVLRESMILMLLAGSSRRWCLRTKPRLLARNEKAATGMGGFCARLPWCFQAVWLSIYSTCFGECGSCVIKYQSRITNPLSRECSCLSGLADYAPLAVCRIQHCERCSDCCMADRCVPPYDLVDLALIGCSLLIIQVMHFHLVDLAEVLLAINVSDISTYHQ